MKKLAPLLFSLLPLMASNSALEQKLYLTIDNQKFELTTDKATKIKIDNKEHNVSLKFAPLSTFKYNDIKFNFPSNLNFSYDASEEAIGLKSWSLNGDNLIIMVLVYNKLYSKEMILQTLLSEYKQMKAKIKREKTILELKNGKKLEGEKVIVYLGNVTLYQEIYIINSTNSKVLMIQDALTDNQKHTQEFENALKILKDSLVLDD